MARVRAGECEELWSKSEHEALFFFHMPRWVIPSPCKDKYFRQHGDAAMKAAHVVQREVEGGGEVTRLAGLFQRRLMALQARTSPAAEVSAASAAAAVSLGAAGRAPDAVHGRLRTRDVPSSAHPLTPSPTPPPVAAPPSPTHPIPSQPATPSGAADTSPDPVLSGDEGDDGECEDGPRAARAAATATGLLSKHNAEQNALVTTALSPDPVDDRIVSP